MSWTFVQKHGGWWLKISSPEELRAYHETMASNNPIARGFRSAVNCREFSTVDGIALRYKFGISEPMQPHVNAEGYAIGLKAQNERTGLLRSAAALAAQTDDAQLDSLAKGSYLLFNRHGGWHCDTDKTYRWIRKADLTFPDLKTKDIKIEKFPAGEHFYAYIGDIQVRDGDTLKWDTYEEAYKKAKEYIR